MAGIFTGAWLAWPLWCMSAVLVIAAGISARATLLDFVRLHDDAGLPGTVMDGRPR
jgi:hypothetical protein